MSRRQRPGSIDPLREDRRGALARGPALEGVPHWHGVPHWFRTKISNGLLERLSSLVQAPKARTRSFRIIRTLVAMTYLLNGKLSDLQPIQSSEEPPFGSAPP